MAATQQPLLGYTVAARVTRGEHHLHMTLAYVGECDETRLRMLEEEIKKCAAHSIVLELGKDEMFGPPEKRDIPVVLCKFVNEEGANVWRSFYERFAELEPGMPPPKPGLQNYHISVKRPGSKEALRAPAWVFPHAVHMKRIGPHGPFCVVPLHGFVYDKSVEGCQDEHPHCPCSDCGEFHLK
jgi:hypothetical protein